MIKNRKFSLTILLLSMFMIFGAGKALSQYYPNYIQSCYTNCLSYPQEEQIRCNALCTRQSDDINAYRQKELYVINRSSYCDQAIEDTINGISTSQGSDSIYYLSNHGIWRGFNLINNLISEKNSTTYYYNEYRDKKPKVTISKATGTLFCQIKIEGVKSEPYAYRK